MSDITRILLDLESYLKTIEGELSRVADQSISLREDLAELDTKVSNLENGVVDPPPPPLGSIPVRSTG